MIGNRNIGIVSTSAAGGLIIRNLNSRLKVILFILILAAGGTFRSFGQSICPAVPLGYQYQKTFEINGSKVGGVLVNFPVLVNITNPQSNDLRNIVSGGHVCDINGDDIIFTDANYNRLEHQIESYSSTTGRLVAWVKFPLLSNAGNTTFRILYGNCQITASQSSESVWNPDYRGVWHLNGTDYTDVTSAGNDGTSNSVSSVGGKIGQAVDFNGSSSYILMSSFNGSVACNEPQTISVWARFNSAPSGVQNLISFQNTASTSSVQVGFRNSDPIAWKWGGEELASSSATPSGGTWHYYVYTFDGTSHHLYIDGVPHEGTTAPQTGIPNEANLGRYNDGSGGNEFFKGYLDEARYSVTARSAEWITTEFNNQNDQAIGAGKFIQSVGSETEYNSPSNYIFDLCEGTTVSYYLPSQAGHTYTWTITGGTPATYAGNPVTVTWGAPGTGTIMLNDHNGICDKNSPVYSVIIRPRPTAPVLNAKTPNLAEVCAGQSVSATFYPGTGGVGCTDQYQYRFDGAGVWQPYVPGTGLSTTGRTLVEIQGRRAGCTGGPGCTESDWADLASWIVNPQPVAPTLALKTPNLMEVCAGQTVSATFNPGSGGTGCADAFQYRFGAGAWQNYVSGQSLSTTGHASVTIRGQRGGCTSLSGCAGTSWVNLASWTVNPQPLAPAINTRIPDLASVCEGTLVSATFNSGTGGSGCTDSFQYRFDGTGAWNEYIPGNTVNTTGHTLVEIQGRRADCTTGSGCTGTDWATLASWNVNPQPVGPSLNAKSPDLGEVCSGQAVSATFVAGSGGVGCTDSFRYSYDGTGTWTAYTPGSTINTTGHTLIEIQGRRSGCTTGSGCMGTDWTTLVSWNVNPQPVGPMLNAKSPDIGAVCSGQAVSATFVAGSGGVGCTDSFRYSYDGTGTWTTYTPGSTILTTGHTLIEIQGRRSGCTTGSGCTGTDWTTLVSWIVNLQPTGPILNVKSPDIGEVCSGQAVSATFVAGSGGVGCTDSFRYSYDGTGTWTAYTPGSTINTTGHTLIEIQGRRSGCTTGSGCTGTDWTTLVSWIVNLQPTGPILNVKSPDIGAVCSGQAVSATFVAGSGGVGCTDSFRYSYDGTGTWTTYTPGSTINTTGHTLIEIQGRRSDCTTGSGCTGTDWTTLVSWNVNLQPAGPALDARSPDLGAVCDGELVSATFTSGTGGVGCTDSFQYRLDGTGAWIGYTPGSPINTSGKTLVEIQGRRTGCTPESGCTGTEWATLVTWAVNPWPVLTSTQTPLPICSGSVFGYDPESSVPSTGFAWTRAAITGILPATDGSGNGNPNETLVNTTPDPITVRYKYTLTANGCTSAAVFNVDVVVKPMPVLSSSLTPAPVCSGSVFNYSPLSLTTGTGFAWIRGEIAGIEPSGSASGSDDPAETLTNTTLSPVVVTYIYRLTADGCTNPSDFTVSVTVNPTAHAEQPVNQVVCNDESTDAVIFATDNTDGTVTYTWTNDTPSIGLAGTGNGDILSFTAENTGLAPVVATIVVTPHFENGGVTCDGPTKTFTITVNPTAHAEQPLNQVVCNDESTDAVIFATDNTDGTVTYTWTNDTPSIGLAGTGNGDILSFTAENTGLAPVVATIVVTPHFENGGVTCDGPTKTFTITVNPTAHAEQPVNQVVCNDESTDAVIFATDNTDGTVTYTWTNDTPSIGLAGTGNGDILSFTAENTGLAPVVATIVVTPHFENGGVTCDGPTKTFTITVNPTAHAEQPLNQVVCNDESTDAVIFATDNTDGTVTYTWTNDTPSIGLAGTGNGDILSFTAENTGLAPVVATIVVTPHFENGGVTCDGPTKTFTITVNPTAHAEQPVNQVVCNDESTDAVIFATDNTDGTVTYTWTNDTPSIGLAGTGNGDIPSFTAENTGLAPVVATIVVTPHFENGGVTCDGPTKTFTITVNPTAHVEQPLNQVVCNDESTDAVIFATDNTDGTVTYTWTNDTPSIGLAGTGNGDILSFTAENTGLAPVVATIVVTPHFENGGVTCDGPTKTFTITVNPTAHAEQPLNQVVCNDESTDAVIFATDNTDGTVTYTWTNDTPSIGLAGTGNGDILSFTAENTGLAPVVATIVVTPHFENGGVTCDGPTKTFTITVNPTAHVEQPLNQVVCNDESTDAVIFATDNTDGTVTYTWTNDTPSIGLAGTGNGDILSFTAENTGLAPVVATIVVTPHFENGGVTCDGPTKTFTITVNPTAHAEQPLNQVVCNDESTDAVIFATDNTDGTVTYTWTNDTPSIGLAGTGNGDILSFTAENTGLAPVVATIVVTPHFENGGVTCDGPTKTFTITVNPTAHAEQPLNQVVCNDESTDAVIFATDNTDGTVTYTWTNDTPSIGLAGTGNGDILSFTAENTGLAPVVATIVVTPHFENGGVTCDGPTKTFTITVNPTAHAEQPLNQVVCNDESTDAVIFATDNTDGTVTYTWTNDTPSIGLAGTGNGDILSFTAENTGLAPVVATIVVTPHFENGGVTCDGPTKTFTITVNPTAHVEQPVNQVVCNDESTDAVIFATDNTDGTVTYTWTNDTPSIGLAGTGNGDILSFTAENTGLAPVVATIVVTPHFENGGVTCDGPTKTFTITVNPTAHAEQPLNQVVCNDESTDAVIFATDNTDGTVTYTWTNDTPSIGLAGTGNGDILSFTAENTGLAPVVATIVVTPHFENGGVTCDGPTKTFTITVNPTAHAEQPLNQVVCNDESTDAVIFATDNTDGTVTYTWTNDTPSIGLAGTGNGDILSFTAENTGLAPVVATIVVTPHFENGGVTCDGPTKTFTITVNPTAHAEQPLNQVVCNDESTDAVIFATDNTDGTVTYTWTNDTPSIGLAGTGNGDILSFTAENTGLAPVVATIVVTPHFENGGVTCDGPTKTFTITVNPTADVVQPVNQVVCNDAPTLDIVFNTGNTVGITTYTWENDTPTIGLAASGDGDILSFIAVNDGDAPVIATIEVTPHFTFGGITCDGPSKTFTITVDPTPQIVPSTLTQTICNNGQTNIIIGSPSTYSSGVITFEYTVIATGGVTGFTTPVTGLPKDYVIEDILVNPTNEIQTVTYTITPVTATGCGSGPATVIVTVLPTPQVATPDDQILCNGQVSDEVIPGTLTVGDVTFTWTNSDPSIGLPASGDGNIPSFTAINNGDNPVVAEIRLIPHFTYDGYMCDGLPRVFYIRVNPTPRIDPVPVDVTQCDSTTTNIILRSPSTFTSGLITFRFTATATGGVTGFTPSASGLPNNHVIADNLVNPTGEPQTVTYIITPVSPVGCDDGPSVTVSVTINPTPRIVQVDPIIQCDSTTTSITLQSLSTFTEGLVSFRYDAVATGGVTGFTSGLSGLPNNYVIADNLVNPTDSPQTVTYTVTPVSPVTGCNDGPSADIVVTVNPTPRINPVVPVIQCDSTTTGIVLQSPSTFTDGNVSFSYTAAAPAGISGFTPAASGLPNNHVITDFLINLTDSPQTVTYTVTPESPAAGCSDGPSIDIVVTVNPTPRVIPVVPEPQCDSTATSITLQSPGTFTSGVVTFRYTAAATGGVTGFTPNATSLPNNHVIEDILINPTDEPQAVTYTVTPVNPVGGCSDGPSVDIVVRVNPTPRVLPVVPPPQCDSTNTNITLHSPSTFTSGVVKFRYTATAPAGITGYTTSDDNLDNDYVIADFLVNLTDSPQTVTYTVTPVSPLGCNDGPSVDITVTVNPTPRVYPEPDDIIQCDSTATDITLESPSTFTTGLVTFRFTASATGGVTGFTPGASGLPNNHVIDDNLVNPTDLPQTVTYIITPVSPLGCNDGPSVSVVVTINPTPRIIPVIPVIQCDSTTTAITLQSPSTFTTGLITFKYTTSAPAEVTGHTPSATDLPNNHVITDNLVNLSDSPQTVTYHVVPVSPLPCADGPGIDITVTINPTPRISPVPQDIIICDSTTTSITVESPSTFTSGTVTINYTASAPAGLSGYTENATGLSSGFIIADNLINTTDAPLTVTYRLVPVSGVVCNNGPAIEVKVTVNPTPRAVPVNVSPAICYGDLTAIRLESPTIMTSGEIRFDYDIAVASGVAGNPDSGIGMRPGDVLSFRYSNTDDTVLSVFFSITPKVDGLNCPAGNASVQEVRLHPRPVRGINILEPFTCEASVGLATLEAVISRGAGPYSVSWGGPVGYTKKDSLVITNLYAGYYWLEVADNLGCKGDSSINIANLSASPRIIPIPVLPNIHVSCPGGNDGTARIFVREGITKPYSYWFMDEDGDVLYTGVFSDIYDVNDPTTYNVCENLTAGTYTLLIRDLNGCETTRQAELNDPEPIIVSMDLSDYRGSNISCRGYSDGFVEARATGGTDPYTYFWYPASGSLTVSNNTSRLDSIPAGKYYLLVTDFMGCTMTDSITLTDPPGMDLASSEVSHSNDNIYNISCNGASDGYIKIEVTGGSGNYTYSWTGPDGYSAVTKDISGRKAGTYTCTVTDINGCILTPKPEFLLEEPAPLVVSSMSSESADGDFNITCAGGTGTVDVTVTGGSEDNYIYLWTTADGSGIVPGEQDQNSLTAGTYHLRVTDLNGCITETDITLTEPPALVAELVPTHINCQVSGFNNGSIDLEVSGGIAPYSYLWSNGAVTQDISGLTQGTYQVEVTDASGCQTSGSILIEDPPPLTYEPVISEYNGYNISCYGRSDGSVQINPTTGTPPYVFSWEGPDGFTATTKDISGLKAGLYNLSIIDSKMCTVRETIELTEPGSLGMIVTTSESITGGKNIDCAGGKTGSISVESVNNAGSVDYLWSDGEMGSTRTGLMAGYYKVITIDSNGCTADSTILLTEPDSIAISFAVTQPQCTDMPDGQININVTGGANSGYTYLWSDNSTTQNIATAVSGVYSVTVTDANGCSVTRSVTINPVNDLCLSLPNAISPNGDNINDLWNIGLRELYPEMEVTIFNRWGDSVWKSGRGYPVPWDGRSNGNMLPMDSYHYIIDLKKGRKPIIGTITIVK